MGPQESTQTTRRSLVQSVLDARERGVELRAQTLDDGDDGDRDAGRDQPVLDRGGPALVGMNFAKIDLVGFIRLLPCFVIATTVTFAANP
jgi:hypothetical protein